MRPKLRAEVTGKIIAQVVKGKHSITNDCFKHLQDSQENYYVSRNPKVTNMILRYRKENIRTFKMQHYWSELKAHIHYLC